MKQDQDIKSGTEVSDEYVEKDIAAKALKNYSIKRKIRNQMAKLSRRKNRK